MRPLSLLVAVLAATAVPASAQVLRPVLDQPSSAFEERLLEAHNAERERLGIARLRWSDRLARQAQQWASYQARHQLFDHAQERYGAGENLWMGPEGRFAPEDMIQSFIDERRYFQPGRFPDVSSTRSWYDVGHYTQLIWPGTQELGCAVASSAGNEYLVCRYYPAGNVMTQRVP